MNFPNIDEPTRIVLDYVRKFQGDSIARKRRKLNCGETSVVIRPCDFPGIECQLLCDILLRGAFNGGRIDETFREHILDLVEDQSVGWNHVLCAIRNTNCDLLYMKSQMCQIVREMIHFVQIKSFDDSRHADLLGSEVLPTLVFVSKVLQDLLGDENGMNAMQKLYEDPQKPYQKPLEALNTIIHDELCGALLAMKNSSEVVMEQLRLCRDAFSKLRRPDEDAVGLMHLLIEKHEENCKPIQYEYIPDGLNLYQLKNPAIKILVPIFACFRCHETSEQMAQTVQTFIYIMRAPGEAVIFDLLHATILLKCEESNNLLHLTKQHRLDFRWQTTTFFYKKLPQIIENLLREGKVTTEHVKDGLERALNHLTMLFDVADASWQNASFLTLLNNLEPLIGEEAATPLRQRRREYMKTTPNLVALAESDEKPIPNTDIDKLLSAVKDVMSLQFGQNEEFYEIFTQKIYSEDCDDFDAITSILASDGRLLEIGKAFALKNKMAQYPSPLSVEERIRSFDETFLLLTRIIIKMPSLSIGLLVNGGPGIPETAKAIFYRWSMWFVKRVPKKDKTQEKTEEELIELRTKAEMLVGQMNAEVGIVEELGDEDEEEKKDEDPLKESEETTKKASPQKDVDMSEEQEKEPEVEEGDKMDTSEGPSEPQETPSTSDDAPKDSAPTEVKKETPKPSEDETEGDKKKEEKEKHKEKKEILEPTWQELNCALPKIPKKRARDYLKKLKEGFPFWSLDDPNVNIGSIVAAIPTIGELLIEEHDEKSHRVDRKAVEEHMTNILHALESMPCLFVCLVQWIDCEPSSPARTLLAKTIKLALDKRVSASSASLPNDKNLSKWRFIKSTVYEMIHELTDRIPVFPDVTCTAFSTARRFCPFVARDEIPDKVKLKHAWYYICQQTWTSPHALRLLEHANINSEYNTWIHLYISKTADSGCGEIMREQVDMIFAILMMDDLNVIIRMHEIMTDHWLSEIVDESLMDGRSDPLAMTAVIRLMSNVMILSEWTLDRLINDGPPLVEPLPFTETMTPEPEDPLRREKWVFLLRNLLDRTVNRLLKILRRGVLCTVVNTIIQLIKAIAGAADCKAKRLLIKRIPPEIIFQLAYIEPQSANYALMNAYCDPDNEEHTRTKIRFLCALRRTQVL